MSIPLKVIVCEKNKMEVYYRFVFFFTRLCMCVWYVHVFMHVYMCEGMHVWIREHMCGGLAIDVGCLFKSLSMLSIEAGSLKPRAHQFWLVQLASSPWKVTCLCRPSPGVTGGHHACLTFLCGFWGGFNLRPLYIPNTVSAEASPQRSVVLLEVLWCLFDVESTPLKGL